MDLEGLLLILQASKNSVPLLVSTKWLAQRLENPEIRIIDTRPTVLYLMGHIRNAVSASYSAAEYLSFGVDISKGGGVELFSDPNAPVAFQDGPPEMIKEVLGKRLGISRKSLVVIYSDGADPLTARFWWTLEHVGHKNMCILNGGLDKWLEDGYKTVKKVTKVRLVEYEISNLDHSCLVDTNWMVEHLASPQVKVVFSLPHTVYYGEETTCPREGHIPGSVCIPVSSHFGQDSTWKSAMELQRMYHNFGITQDKIVISYCLHGVAAATSYFALRHILGYPRVSLYLESVAGWCHDPRNLPLETYGNPQLLREPQWVYYWGEKIQPLMNDPKVRIVDARPTTEYNEGHIPFALSLPAEDIHVDGEEILHSARKIRALLGKIGISTDTKVVIYDQDNAHQAVWLFWVLEYLGHNDVSILNGGFARWRATGRNVTTEVPVIRKSKSKYTFDLSIRPTSFKAAIQPHKVATRDWIDRHLKDPDKLFLNADASPGMMGKVMPEAKNVPWSSNLTEDGVFKTAAQLAMIYDEAGIEQFKEAVCCSETPMHAAHTYFALRLLGYPRVRLCPKLWVSC